MLLTRCAEVCSSVHGWRSRYDPMCLFYVPTMLDFSYCTSVYMSFQHAKGPKGMMVRTKNTLMTMDSFFAAYDMEVCSTRLVILSSIMILAAFLFCYRQLYKMT